MRDERITFQETTRTRSASGSYSNSWSNIDTDPTMWASAVPDNRGENFDADQLAGFQRYTFRVLYRDDLNESMRISWNSKYWNITSINPIHKGMRHREIEIKAEWRDGYYE